LRLRLSSPTSRWHEGQLAAALKRDTGAYLNESPKFPRAAKFCIVGLFATGGRILGNSFLGYVAALYTGNLASN
jgi:hypothetical protein